MKPLLEFLLMLSTNELSQFL
jgi:hypothetical protein